MQVPVARVLSAVAWIFRLKKAPQVTREEVMYDEGEKYG
jgi:hypothetical protein